MHADMPLPKYHQIYLVLKEGLLEGKFAPKDVVPVDVDPIRSPGEFHFGRVVH